MKVTAVFDIGKTNKKLFLFDENYQVVLKKYVQFEEKLDEDGYECDDLFAIKSWLTNSLHQILTDDQYDVQTINFSGYGASFVHLDRYGRPVAPLYNYLKPFPQDLLDQFHSKYGSPLTFARQTASPPLGMLNSGLQLYWLKYHKPEIYRNVRWSLHLPQFLSYLVTAFPVSDFTSVGCHTGLWDYAENDYHKWVYEEQIDRLLAPIADTHLSINKNFRGKVVKVGLGIHDSSSALLPYILSDKEPFLLISTGTWSIALNPFSQEVLTDEDLQNDCLNYMRIDGQPVKAARLFLGHEYKSQVKRLHTHFEKREGYHRNIHFDKSLISNLKQGYSRKFKFENMVKEKSAAVSNTRLDVFPNFETAYHQLMLELVDFQIESADRAIGKTPVKKIYIDGGFADNEIYVELLSQHFVDQQIITTQSPLGSALGAALVISEAGIDQHFMKEHFALKRFS